MSPDVANCLVGAKLSSLENHWYRAFQYEKHFDLLNNSIRDFLNPYFTKEETEAQKSKVTCLKSHK